MSRLQGLGRRFAAQCGTSSARFTLLLTSGEGNAQRTATNASEGLQQGWCGYYWRSMWTTTSGREMPIKNQELKAPALPEQRADLHTSTASNVEEGEGGSGGQPRRRPSTPRATAKSNMGIGTIYVQCTKNNTICTLVDTKGMPVAWTSAGSCGFKNSRKKSTQVSQTVAETLIEKVLDKGFEQVRVVMKGMGYGKQTAVRAITKSRLKVLEIHEQTAIPHNGCRAPKRRRI